MYKNTFLVQDAPDLLYAIALTLLPGIGDRTAKRILSVTGTAEDFFKESLKLKYAMVRSLEITKVTIAQAINRAEQELKFIEKNGLETFICSDPGYPSRLKACEDGPLVIFTKGKIRLNEARVVAVVGTRKSTRYGEEMCDAIVEQLAIHNCTLISGLAHGIDSQAHRAALLSNIQNIGVLAHGLDRLYPAINSNLAGKMIENGGLVTDFLSKTNPDRENFPKRNRIVAGLADAVIVVEAAKSGGALITAEIANSYGREVFSVPGRMQDEFSVGCNNLIRQNKAAILSQPSDLAWYMGWEKHEVKKPAAVQQKLFYDFTPDEEGIVSLIRKNIFDLDTISVMSGFSVSKTSTVLLGLEFKGAIRSQPGKRYQLIV